MAELKLLPPCDIILDHWMMDGHDTPQPRYCNRDAEYVLKGEIAICALCVAHLKAGDGEIKIPETGRYKSWLLSVAAVCKHYGVPQ